MTANTIVQRKIRQARLRELIVEYRSAAPCARATREGIAAKLRRELTSFLEDDGPTDGWRSAARDTPSVAAADAGEVVCAAERYLEQEAPRLHEEMRSWLTGPGRASG